MFTPVINCSAVSTTLAKNLSPVSLTPVNNFYFHSVVDTVQKKTKKPTEILKLFTGVNDTADKFFGSVSDTGD